MPLWFIDTPSETEMVVNATGTAPPAATPSRADADQRLAEVLIVEATGTQESAMRRAIEAVDGDARAIAALTHDQVRD